ncbi:MAG: hypothetical protein MJ069_03615 [Salinivirgaceae bacterium]|nr:hypothetical protein [Salinivirgaceae bacterium]
MRRLTKLAVIALIALVGNANAQNNTISPYSRLGLGQYEPVGFARNLGMGNTGVALRSPSFVNIVNPASYVGIDSTMVMLDIGMHADYQYIETKLDTGDKLNGNISYFSIAMSVSSKWALNFAISPYSSTGYTIKTTENVSGGGDATYTSFTEGLGGLTRMHLGVGYKLLKYTSIGMNATILFGPKTERQSMQFTNSDPFSTYTEVTNYNTGGKLDFGIQQEIPLKKSDDKLVIGLIASTPGIMYCNETRFASVTYVKAGITDTIYYDDDDGRRYTRLPYTAGFGLSYNKGKRLTISADFNYNPLSKLDMKEDRTKFLDNKTVNFGVEYCPHRFGEKYELAFRGGLAYENGCYQFDNFRLRTYSATMGAGCRIKSIRLNSYIAWRRQGTIENLLVLENSMQFGINLTYIDFWFQKRRFN